MKSVIASAFVAVASAALPSAVEAQIFIMGRTDRADVRWAANTVDPEAVVRRRATEAGGSWKILLSSTRCGYASVWGASNGSQIEYFVSEGHPSARESSEAAQAMARRYAQNRPGWRYSSYRQGLLNENRHTPSPTMLQRLEQEVFTRASCMNQRRNGYTGVRG